MKAGPIGRLAGRGAISRYHAGARKGSVGAGRAWPWKLEGAEGMRCGCQECGALMVNVERGLRSHCACPLCGAVCNQCLGSGVMLQPTKKVEPLTDDLDAIAPDDRVYRIRKN